MAAACAFVTLWTSDDFSIAIETWVYALVKSLSTNSEPPEIVIMYLESKITKSVLNSVQTKCSRRHSRFTFNWIIVPSIAIPTIKGSAECHVPEWTDVGYTKLNVFNLTTYDKIVFIDADALVLEPIDKLFTIGDDNKALIAAAPDIFPPDKFNAGVMVIRPQTNVFNDMMTKIHTLSTYDGGDTGFLNAYFCNWYNNSAGDCKLPFSYNAQRTMYWMVAQKNIEYWNAIGKIQILHFSSNPKPWAPGGSKKGDLEWIWWKFMMQASSS